MRIRTTAQGEIELAASVEEFKALRARVRDIVVGAAEAVSVAAEMGYDPSPYDAILARLVIERIDQPVCAAIAGDALRIAGSSKGLDAFCSDLAFDDAAVPGCHSHYEHYDGHPFISPDSMPLVIAVGYVQAAPPN